MGSNKYGIDLSKMSASGAYVAIESKAVIEGNINIKTVGSGSSKAGQFDNAVLLVEAEHKGQGINLEKTLPIETPQQQQAQTSVQAMTHNPFLEPAPSAVPTPNSDITNPFLTPIPEPIPIETPPLSAPNPAPASEPFVPTPEPSSPPTPEPIPGPAPRHGDVTFLVDGHEILAFKAVLNVKSPIFAAMIKRNPNSPIPLPGVKWQVFEAMLQYYDNEDNDSSIRQNALEVLPFASKFQINELKHKCENILISKLEFSTVAQYLSLAEKNNAGSLKEKAVEYINECPSIKETDEYQQILVEQPTLMMDLY